MGIWILKQKCNKKNSKKFGKKCFPFLKKKIKAIHFFYLLGKLPVVEEKRAKDGYDNISFCEIWIRILLKLYRTNP